MGDCLCAQKLSLQDGLYDSEHKPRLTYARSYFLGYTDGDPDLEGLAKFYVDWRDYPEYIVVQKQTDNLRIEGKIDKETIAVKCSKRGNDVYWWRVWKRVEKLYNLKEQTLFDSHSNIKSSNVLFATLTYDTRLLVMYGKQKAKISTNGLET